MRSPISVFTSCVVVRHYASHNGVELGRDLDLCMHYACMPLADGPSDGLHEAFQFLLYNFTQKMLY